ncbi:MAG: thioredoxin domain-containing protein [Nitrospirae bacterium]|nr:thioredoxin domain-containing protein [Nitrospirota bacterium]
MAITRSASIILSMVLLPVLLSADDNPSIKGIYKRLPGHQYSSDGKTVEVVEFMSFYCGHCYELEKSIPVIKGNFPKKIKWRIVPIYWGKGSPKPGEAYLLAVDEGKGELMKKALFDAVFIQKKDIGDVEVLDELGAKLGLGFDFSRRLRAGDKAKDVGEASIMSKTYDIDETPTLIIAGNLKVSPGLVDHNMDIFRDNAIVILKSILKD